MSMSAKLQILAAEEVAVHHSTGDCWVSYHGKVYDVSRFLGDHPGGEDVVLRYGGRVVDDVMGDSNGHEHSDAARRRAKYHYDETDAAADFARNEFLDLTRPLVMQVWRGKFRLYLKQVHQPRYLPEQLYCLIFTKATWYTPPIVWLPVAGYLFLRSLFQFAPSLPLSLMGAIPFESYGKAVLCFLVGNFLWTILEYLVHRFLFHLDDYLPDHNVALTLHFLLHGIHHYLPMDRYLVPTTFTRIHWFPPDDVCRATVPFTMLIYKLFPVAVANGLIAGGFTFCMPLESSQVHHTNLPEYLKEMKKYHSDTITRATTWGKLWDVVFGTVLPV
ncbi:hypothetical protein CPB85DRAFT_1377207 [Mucidula mucida]|nr:hypothetical protein CPB85DRAFT_1377207 [Mucidula mucida]